MQTAAHGFPSGASRSLPANCSRVRPRATAYQYGPQAAASGKAASAARLREKEARSEKRSFPCKAGLPLLVQSGYLEDPDWNNSTVLRGKVVDEVSKLKRCHGSAAKQVR
jgi:hypothetical protein